MSRRGAKAFWRNQTGATAALYALALPALVAVAGIGFDYARIASMDSELQNAADQAALAAATQLDKQAGAIARATSAAQGGLVSNSTLFANDTGQTRTVDVFSVRFYTSKTAAEGCAAGNAIVPTSTGADASAAFVCVTVETRTANYALTPVVGALSGSLAAQAAAGIGSALCRTPPLMVCNPAESTTNTNPNLDFNANAYAGVGLLAKGGGGSSWAPGNFGYVDTVPGPGGGTPDLLKAFGWTSPAGNCVSQSGNTTVDTETGNHASVADALNTRFDIYNGNGVCPSGGACPASINSTKDVAHPADFVATGACGLGNSGWEEPSTDPYRPTDPTTPLPVTTIPSSMGHPRDLCHAVSEDGACSGGAFGTGVWDWDAYFRSQYGWLAAEWRTHTQYGLSTTGALPAGPHGGPTRYEVYKWEIANRGNPFTSSLRPPTVTVLGSKATDGSRSAYGTPQCSAGRGYGAGTVPNATTADRRRVSVAVVNCVANGVKGNTSGVPVRRWIDVFLVQPSLDRGSGSNKRSQKDQIYVEIIGETTSGSSGETAGSVVRRDLPYLLK